MARPSFSISHLLIALLVFGALPVLAVPPAAPTDFTAVLTKTSPLATHPHTYAFLWTDNATDEDGFEIVARIGTSGAFSLLTTASASAETGGTGRISYVSAFANGTTLQFQVRAYKGSPTPTEFSTVSNISTVVIPVTTFNPPTNITGTPLSQTVIRVGWQDASTSEDGVELWMAQQPGGTFSKLADIEFYKAPQISISGLFPGVGYQFKLRAYRDTTPRTYSAYSANSATFFTSPPTAPTGLVASNVGSSSLTLTWVDNDTLNTSYEVLTRPSGAGAFTVHEVTTANATTASLTGLQPGVSLDFAVRARADYGATPGFSANSNVVTQLMKDEIISPHYAQVLVGQPFAYSLITTTGSPRLTRTVTGLPSGLTYDGDTGMITGTPDTPGVTLATMTATFTDGSSHSPGLSIRVLNPPAVGTAIPAQSLSTGVPVTIPLGSAFTDPEAPSAVKVVTTLGTMNFILFNNTKPLTVANFMSYVNSGAYNNNLFHRAVPGFLIQGGRFKPTAPPNNFTEAPKFSPVLNEPGISNTRGTISLAKPPVSPDGATIEFFINLENNGPILDAQNGGFTVFGRVAGNGISVADEIVKKPVGNYVVGADGDGISMTEWPLNSPDALVAMDNTKVIGITSMTPTSVFSHAITANTNAGAVTAAIVGTNLILTPVAPGTANITLLATNLDGYTVSQTFAVTTRSSAATLASLASSTGALNPVFSSGTTSYAVNVPNTTASLTLTPTTSQSQAVVQVNGIPVNSGSASGVIPLLVGSNIITVLVTAEDGTTTKTYTLNFTRAAALPAVTTVAATAVGVSGATLNGTVNARSSNTSVVFDYGLTTAYGSSITAVPSPLTGSSSSAVSAVLGGLTPGKTYNFRVRGANVAGSASGANMTFITKSTVATLSNLVLSAGTLSPVFSSAGSAFAATVSNATASIRVTPTLSQPQATVQVNGIVVPSGRASGAITLAPGVNVITILVTAQDGLTTKSHTLTITRAPVPVVATLEATNVAATGARFNGTVNAGGASTVVTFDYGTTTAYGSSVTATPSPMTGTSSAAASATLTTLLPSTTYHYRIKAVSLGGTVTGASATFTTPSNVATLSGLALSTGALTPGFASAVTSYTQNVSNATTSLTVTPTLTNPLTTVRVNGIATASGTPSAAVALALGSNIINVQVTALDGVTTKTYTVNVTRLAPPVVVTLPATNLTAVGVKLNGTINALNTNTAASFVYGLTTAYGSSAVAVPTTVTGNAVTSVSATLAGLTPGATYHYKARGVSVGGTVLGENGAFTTPSNVATLSGLVMSSGVLSPGFASATTGYTNTVPNTTTSLTVTPASSNANATVKVNGLPVASGNSSGAINLNVGSNVISVLVTAQDGTTTKTYTINVTRQPGFASLATQAATGITTTSATLNGIVNTARDTSTALSFDYGTTAAFGLNTAAVPTPVTGTLSTPVSKTLTGLAPGTTYHYRVKGANAAGTATGANATFTTVSNLATLSSLTLSTGALSPLFSSATTSYTHSVPNATSLLTVTPTTGNANAIVTVNSVNVTSGSPSGPIALSPGLNTITVQVTAQDGVTTKTYILNVTRLTPPLVVTMAPSNLTAVGVKLNGTINAINSSTAASFIYGLTTAYGSTANATPTPVTGNAVTAVSATLTGLTPGATYHYKVRGVSAGGTSLGDDGTFSTPSNVATLSDLVSSIGVLTPVFTTATTSYSQTVPNATTSLTVIPVLSNANAVVTVNGVGVLSGNVSDVINLSPGLNTITVRVTAQDGVTVKIYTLNVTRQGAPVVVTLPATNLTSTGVKLNGSVNALNTSTTATFSYGLTTAYGSTVNATPLTVTGSAVTAVSATLANLTPGTTYHYRVNGVSAMGTTPGGDETFTTPHNVATLSALALSSGTLSPVFAGATTAYTASVGNSTAAITVTPTVSQAAATVKVNGVTVASAAASGAVNLNVGTNVITVLVTAQNGTTTKAYTVTVTRAAAPASIATQAATNIGTTVATLNGTVNTANSTSTTMSFDYGTSAAFGLNTAATPTPVGGTAFTPVSKVLTGLTPGTTYHYRVKGVNAAGTVTGASATFTTVSNVATLSGLSLNTGALVPAFASATTSYTHVVSNATTSLTVTPTLSNAHAKVALNSVLVASGVTSAPISLSPGSNIITLQVTAQDGVTVRTYTVNVTRQAPPSVVTLPVTNLTATGVKLNGTIHALNSSTTASFNYGLTAAYGSTVAATPSIVTGGVVTGVSANLSGLTPGTTYHYQVKGVSAGGTPVGADATFTTPSNVSTLSGLVLSSGALSPAFSSATTGYTHTVSNSTTSLTVTPTLSNANATVKVNGVIVASGSPSDAVNLNVGSNAISVLVTAQDGTTNKTYTINVTRTALAPTMATLAATGVTVTGATLNGTANANHAGTTVSFDFGPTAAYGSSVTAAPSPLTGNATTAVSAVINGLLPGTIYHYRVKGVNQAGTTPGLNMTFTTPSNVATLSGLVLSSGALSPVFASGTTVYSQTVPNTTTSLTVKPTATHVSAALLLNGAPITSGSTSGSIALTPGLNVITVQATAQDGITTVTYTVNVTRTAVAPTAATLLADNVNATGATLHGTVNALGSSTNVSFNYGLTTAYGSNAVATESPVSGTGATPVSVVLTGLTPSTTYHFRVSAQNAGGLASGMNATFTTPSNVATLSGLTLSTGALTPVFDSGTTTYSQTVSNATTSLTVTPTATSGTSTLLLNNTASIASGGISGDISLSVGVNTITVKVTAQDGTSTSTYTVNVTRNPPAPVVETLAADNVTATGATLHGTVNAQGASTTVSFNHGLGTDYGSSVAAVESPVTGSSATPVSVVLTGLTPSTTYHFRVSALNDGGLSNGADASFTTPGNVATLSALALSAGTLDPAFDSETTSYTATVDNSTTSVTVTPTVSDSAATVKVNSVSVTSGSASGAISLDEGENVITVVGTAEDGTTAKTYTLTVTREAPVAPAPSFVGGGGAPLAPLKARLTGPVANGGVLPGADVEFTWEAGEGVTEYWLSIGSSEGGADLYDQSQGSALTQTVILPTDGSDLHVSLKSKINGSWLANNYLFAAADTSIKAVLTAPADETKTSQADVGFTWNEVAGASEYWLSIGSTAGGTDVYDASQGTGLSRTVTLPTDGRELFVTLKTKLDGKWASSSRVIFASGEGAPVAAKMTSPANHSVLNGTSVTFTWDAGAGVSEYWLSVGSSVTATDLFSASQGTGQSATLTIPADGSPLYFTLSSLIDGNWQSNLYLYEAAVPAN